ncbi:DUF2790 domain-containing protein [uncultured Pseudomonas sp.]|uniref:DUF2790 domain-containing protein n=1 Tax=uncultured Pseudomonas sp. TaxID=114707 RepID=UPI002587E62C|nr:DUF2790 domain-containing protein [uncultured Pseudomonas sp.]
MKVSIAIAALSAALASCSALAGSSTGETDAKPYSYGMPLDIAKVISITPASNAARCQVGTAHMVYVDHQGQEHAVDYREMGNCSQQ